MLLSLEQILRGVAKDKKLKKPQKWIEEKLEHCEIYSDYYNFVHLVSHKGMWFGVRDAKFECKPFILYKERENTEYLSFSEFEIYTFPSLSDPTFLEIVKDAYQYSFESVKDLRLYFNATSVEVKVQLSDDSFCELQKYNDLDGGFAILTDLFTLKLLGEQEVIKYFNNKELLELDLLKLKDGVNKVLDEYYSTNGLKVYLTEDIVVSHKGSALPFGFVELPDAPPAILWL